MSQASYVESFDGTKLIKTFDYTSWFSTNNTNCPLSSLTIYFTTNNTATVAETIAGVSFVPSTTTFSVDLPSWHADVAFAINTEKIFYLVVESAMPALHRQIFELRFNKTLNKCWNSTADSIILSLPSNTTSFNNDTVK